MSAFAEDHAHMAAVGAGLARLADTASALAARGEGEQAAQVIQTAAHLALLNQPGALAFEQLEATATAIADDALAPWPAHRSASTDAPERVLHVLSETYAVGGHTRLASRWIARDAARSHVVVLTRQGEPSPAVAATFEQLGIPVLSVGTPETPMLERARDLRGLAASFDLVVLHIHPDDVPAILAFEPGPGRPPTVFMNHADHAPWVGRRAFDVVLACRGDGSVVAQELRGIPAERCGVLPLPGDPPQMLPSRAEARAALGIPDEAEVLLTLGHPVKFTPLTGETLGGAILPTLHARPAASLIVVGPHANLQPWPGLIAQSGGKLHVIGPSLDLAPFYAAADALIESYPLAGGTVVVEAALHNVPVITYRPDARARGLFCQEPITDPDPRLHASTPAELQAQIGVLLDSPGEAQRRAAAFREATLAIHAGPGWSAQLEEAYARARALAGGSGPAPGPVPPLDPTDETLPLLSRYNRNATAASSLEDIDASTRAIALAATSPAIRKQLPDVLGVASAPLPAPIAGALAAPEPREDDLATHLTALRALVVARVTDRVALTLPAEGIEASMAVAGPVLSAQDDEAGWELPVDVIPYGDTPVLPTGWLAVGDPARAPAWWGSAPVHPITPPVAAHA